MCGNPPADMFALAAPNCVFQLFFLFLHIIIVYRGAILTHSSSCGIRIRVIPHIMVIVAILNMNIIMADAHDHHYHDFGNYRYFHVVGQTQEAL